MLRVPSARMTSFDANAPFLLFILSTIITLVYFVKTYAFQGLDVYGLRLVAILVKEKSLLRDMWEY